MSDVVFPEELLYFVQSLRPFQIHEVGSKHWMDCHEMVIKLSQQATLEAATHREECVKEYLILHDKLKVLIHEAYCVMLWKTRVLPHLLDIDPNPHATFLIYTVLFHEGSVIALLDIALYHQSGCESLKEASVDLVDYCAQALAQLIGLVSMGYHENETKLDVDESTLTEMERQKRDMQYKVGLRCISIANYLAMNLDALPISAARRMVTTHDIPWLLADLLNFKPWQRKTSKGVQKYIDETWTTVSGEEMAKVTQHEAQTWFCLRQLLFNTSLMEIYELNDSRRKRLGQCHGLLHDTLLDQLPPLADLKNYLCTLGMSGSQSKPKTNLMLEEVPQISEKLIIEAEKNGCFLAIAQKQAEIFLSSSTEEIFKLAQRLNTAYNTDFLAEMEGSKNDAKVESKSERRCGACKKQAEKKCSKCKQVFYCSRECQLEDWPTHKNQCFNPELPD